MVHGKKGTKTSFACTLCDYQADSKRPMYNHISENHSQQISCPKCGEIFPDLNQLELHKSMPHPNLKYQCPSCELAFPTNQQMRSHKKRHTLVKCAFCSEEIPKLRNKKHLLTFHKDVMPTCGACGYKDENQQRIETHQRKVHLKETNFSCDDCDYKCFELKQLRRHRISHEAPKLYECRFCKKTFPRHSTHKVHEMIHTGERKKVCSVCDAAFVQKASLNYHMLKHHPDHV